MDRGRFERRWSDENDWQPVHQIMVEFVINGTRGNADDHIKWMKENPNKEFIADDDESFRWVNTI